MKTYKNKQELCADYPNIMKDMIYRLVTRGKDEYEVDEEYGETGFLSLTECLSFDFANRRYNVIKFISKDYEDDLYELPEEKEQFKDNIIKLKYSEFEVWLHKLNINSPENRFCNNKTYLSPDYFIIDGLSDSSWTYSDDWLDFAESLNYPIEVYLIGNCKAELISREFEVYSILEKKVISVEDCVDMKEIYDYFIDLTNSFPEGDYKMIVEFELDDAVYEMSSDKFIDREHVNNTSYYDELQKRILNFNPNIHNLKMTRYYLYWD